MTFLFNLISFFAIFGMIVFIMICIFVVDVLRNKVFRRKRYNWRR